MKQPKRKILFFGTPEIAVPSLEKINQIPEYEIIGVCVFPDKKVGRKQILTPCAVKKRAIALDLPIIEVKNKVELQNFVERTKFDLGVVIAFGIIFPASILKSQKFINVHFSLLPKYRGASPVQSAILNSEEKSGITWQIMAPKLDSGDILFQKEYNIANQKTSVLWDSFAHKTAKNFSEFLNKYFDQRLKPQPQNETDATFCGKFEKSDGAISFKKMTAQEIYQKFCAFDVWPGIFVKTLKGNIKIHELSLTQSPTSHSVECKGGSKIFLEKIQIPGKKIAAISDVLKGNKTIFN